MKPYIRAAIDSGRPPLELILDEPDRPRCKWDGILIKALYLQESYELDGYPIWVEESPDITFVAKDRVIRSAAVVEKARDVESKKKTPTVGKRFWAEAKLKPGAKWPTRAEWIARRGNGEVAPDEGNSLIRASEAEERAREKVAGNDEAARIIAEFEARFKTPDKME